MAGVLHLTSKEINSYEHHHDPALSGGETFDVRGPHPRRMPLDWHPGERPHYYREPRGRGIHEWRGGRRIRYRMGSGSAELHDQDRRKPAPSCRDEHEREEAAARMARPAPPNARDESKTLQRVDDRRTADRRGAVVGDSAVRERFLSRRDRCHARDGRWRGE